MAAKTDYSSMSIADLQALSDEVSAALEAKKDERRQELLKELEALGGSPKSATRRTADEGTGTTRPKPGAKYRSKKSPDVTWTGRGALPNWLKAEMEETGETDKEAFRIAA
ncbi:H-NS histone family protein [Methylopila sp. 73B]|uniref:H-NS histone family protein n=1 Tax=Methylopila sp. 73B TaxID=1120792 RepID=UPI000362CCA9|nr:H-NS histone family protein [Methylopila sp. 73B]